MKYREIKRYKYELMEIFHAIVPQVENDILTPFIALRGNVIEIRKGYCWDGASGPTIDTKDTMRASLVHDALYQLMRMDKLPQSYRPEADKVFHKLLRKNGMGRIRAWYYYQGVKKFGKNSAKVQNSEPKVITV